MGLALIALEDQSWRRGEMEVMIRLLEAVKVYGLASPDTGPSNESRWIERGKNSGVADASISGAEKDGVL